MTVEKVWRRMCGYCVLHGYVLSQNILIIIIQRAVASTTLSTQPIGDDLTVLPVCSSYRIRVCVREWETQHIKRYCLAASKEWTLSENLTSFKSVWKCLCVCALCGLGLCIASMRITAAQTHTISHQHLKEQFNQKMTVLSPSMTYFLLWNRKVNF